MQTMSAVRTLTEPRPRGSGCSCNEFSATSPEHPVILNSCKKFPHAASSLLEQTATPSLKELVTQHRVPNQIG
jgi:hypothetical protein